MALIGRYHSSRSRKLRLGLGRVLTAAAVAACASAPPAPTNVSGRVLDVHGRPIPGARVFIRSEAGQPEGDAVADAEGCYGFTIGHRRKEEATVRIEAEGFEGWAYSVPRDRLTDLVVALDRKVDGEYLRGLRAVTDPAARVWRMEEILALNEQYLSIEELFPFIGELREDLRAAAIRPTRVKVSTGGRLLGTRDGDLLADVALMLLAYWGDPGDAPLVEPWLKTTPWPHAAPAGIEAPTTFAMCTAWAKVHFEQEHAKPPWTYHACTRAVVDPTETRALMRFDVVYAYWSYNMYLVLERASVKDPWRLRTVVDHGHSHLEYRPS